jgi:hypothetical protein
MRLQLITLITSITLSMARLLLVGKRGEKRIIEIGRTPKEVLNVLNVIIPDPRFTRVATPRFQNCPALRISS